MSDSFWMSLFSCIATIVLAYLQVRTRRDVAVVRHEINSVKDELVVATRASALQEGHTKGVAEERAKTERQY